MCSYDAPLRTLSHSGSACAYTPAIVLTDCVVDDPSPLLVPTSWVLAVQRRLAQWMMRLRLALVVLELAAEEGLGAAGGARQKKRCHQTN